MSHDYSGQYVALKRALFELGKHDSVIDDFESVDSCAQLESIYKSVIHEYERYLWDKNISPEKLTVFQALHREYQLNTKPSQYQFIIVIPVADRPQHLNTCLNSILEQSELFGYGGSDSDRSITVIVADDSFDRHNISENQSITDTYRARGLNIEYFGLEQQITFLKSLPVDLIHTLKNIIGNCNFNAFSHKGASIMRNIVYLKLRNMNLQDANHLVYFIDSDQEFKVCIPGVDDNLYAVNYLYELNELFKSHDIRVLTGKVVGDPPVSPAVMTNKLLEDVGSFLLELSSIDMFSECSFHSNCESADDASYHDMAEMFGFKSHDTHFRYSCDIKGPHNHMDCLARFVSRLKGFFYGAHPTRRTWYQYSSAEKSLVNARTVYTGNYIVKPSALEYFIPFANLKLRMAGPVLGRIIKSRLGSQFVSSNLPMLHSRTIDVTDAAEFRSGVNASDEYIDLSGEFENQYFGDVMLFSMEKLTDAGFPERILTNDFVMSVLKEVDESVHEKYMQKQSLIISGLKSIRKIIDDNRIKWNIDPDSKCLDGIEWFIGNIEYNYSKKSHIYTLIDSDEYRINKINRIHSEIINYANDIESWKKATVDKVKSR